MSSKLYDKSSNKDGARPYKSRDYANKISSNLHHFKRDGRFCDIDLISGNTRVKVKISWCGIWWVMLKNFNCLFYSNVTVYSARLFLRSWFQFTGTPCGFGGKLCIFWRDVQCWTRRKPEGSCCTAQCASWHFANDYRLYIYRYMVALSI